jgi:Tol biopolymer transport system component
VGHLLFVRDDVLLAQPFDQSRFRLTGEAVPVAERIGTTISRAFFSVSPAGVLAYRSGTGTSLRLSWYGRDGRVLGSVGSEEAYQDLALSPDGGRVAFTRPTQSAGPQIWILDFARNTQTRLTFSPAGARSPVWSPDGRYIAYSLPAGVGLFVKGVLDAANPELLSNAATLASDWSRDGSYLVFTQLTNRYDVLAVRNPLTPADRKLVTVAASEFSETHGQISPDGHWIAYESNESGRGEVYVRPFPPDDTRPGKWLVSTNGGTQPRWRGDGKELYYLNSSHRVMAVDVNLGGTFQAGTPQSLFQAPAGVADVARFQYDVTRDGKRFLMISPVSGSISSPATVVLNWETALKR